MARLVTAALAVALLMACAHGTSAQEQFSAGAMMNGINGLMRGNQMVASVSGDTWDNDSHRVTTPSLLRGSPAGTVEAEETKTNEPETKTEEPETKTEEPGSAEQTVAEEKVQAEKDVKEKEEEFNKIEAALEKGQITPITAESELGGAVNSTKCDKEACAKLSHEADVKDDKDLGKAAIDGHNPAPRLNQGKGPGELSKLINPDGTLIPHLAGDESDAKPDEPIKEADEAKEVAESLEQRVTVLEKELEQLKEKGIVSEVPADNKDTKEPEEKKEESMKLVAAGDTATTGTVASPAMDAKTPTKEETDTAADEPTPTVTSSIDSGATGTKPPPTVSSSVDAGTPGAVVNPTPSATTVTTVEPTPIIQTTTETANKEAVLQTEGQKV